MASAEIEHAVAEALHRRWFDATFDPAQVERVPPSREDLADARAVLAAVEPFYEKREARLRILIDASNNERQHVREAEIRADQDRKTREQCAKDIEAKRDQFGHRSWDEIAVLTWAARIVREGRKVAAGDPIGRSGGGTVRCAHMEAAVPIDSARARESR